MIELEVIEKENLKKLEISKPYNIIYLDYNNQDGIKIFKNSVGDLEKFTEKDLENIYKMYIFNDDTMISVFNFGNELKYSKISSSEILNPQIKYVYLKSNEKKLEKIKIRIGNIEIKDTDGNEKKIKREVVQYVEYIGGEN